jgi:AraC-like DNA-binding protein
LGAGLDLDSEWPRAVMMLALRALPPGFAVAIAWQLLRDWRTDLVESRREIRLLWLAAGLLYGLLQGVGRWFGGGTLSGWIAMLDPALLLLPLAWLAARSEEIRPSAKGSRPTQISASSEPATADIAQTEPQSEALDVELLARLKGVMQGAQAAYRDEDLSVASLARRLATPEYRLRRAILQGLGHRNFSAYVNGLRLAEVKAALADPRRAQQPVLDLALGAGFGSPGPFNRAFKAETGLTPTEFRAQALVNSSNRSVEFSQVIDS